MNNDVYNIDFTRLLPEPLKNDASILALGKTIANELQENIRLARLALIYPRIDELDEHTLDILARDFHVDWYDDTYPIEAKRAVIKSSVRVHKRLGTKFAIVTAVGDIFPNSEVQEWFEYGGTHHRFRIILDLTNAKAPFELSQILKAAKFYKRLSAHLDEIVYQMSAEIEISTETAVFRFSADITGKSKAGTHPKINVKGGVASACVETLSNVSGKAYQSEITGTTPRRSRMVKFTTVDIAAEEETDNYYVQSDFSGRVKSGESPHRTTSGKTSNGNIAVFSENNNYDFKSALSGTKPNRATAFINNSNSVSANTTAETFLYTSNAAGSDNVGTKPRVNVEGQERSGGLIPTVNAELFFYHVRRCGTVRCGKF